MSQHRSLKSRSGARGQFRSVLKRLERIKKLEEEGRLDENSSCFALPKVKTVRMKSTKSKAAEEKKEAVAEGAEEGVEAKVEEKVEEKVKGKKEEKKKGDKKK
jgi:small basic protein (TIGR04137 family)